jgi:hypothetical protein
LIIPLAAGADLADRIVALLGELVPVAKTVDASGAETPATPGGGIPR